MLLGVDQVVGVSVKGHRISILMVDVRIRLVWGRRGEDRRDGWEAHHKVAGGGDTLSNCEILCTPCHKLTRTYG